MPKSPSDETVERDAEQAPAESEPASSPPPADAPPADAPPADAAEAPPADAADAPQPSEEASAAIAAPAERKESAIPKGADYVSDRNFSEFPLSPEILKGLDDLGYEVATGVQAAAIEPALAGKDLLVRAKTGTGKTAAFGIPIVERIEAGDRKPRAIVLTPTRELALQVAEECAAIAKYKDIRICTVYGGVAIGPQTKALQEGVEMVVGTPGRIIDHIRRGNLDLSSTTMACLDEADEMLSMGFLEDVTKILNKIPPKPQVLLFSATVQGKIASIVKKYLKDPETMMLSTDADRVEGIRHVLYETDPSVHKVRSLLAVIDKEQPSSVLIFTNTREDTTTVANFLRRQGLDAEYISGELPQAKREQAMSRLKRHQIQFLVATDVAARGIDISDLSHVLMYSLPEDPAVYLHRSGRTGRLGKEGICISLAGGADLSTRLTLERQYDIAFEVFSVPTQEEATELRLTSQVKRLRAAMGSSAFESYLPTVRALKNHPQGDMLLAVALRNFFAWDRLKSQKSAATGDGEARREVPSRSHQGSRGRPQGRGGDNRRRRGRPRRKRGRR